MLFSKPVRRVLGLSAAIGLLFGFEGNRALAQNLSTVTVAPTTVVGGAATTVTGTATLSAAAPAGGKVVTLASNNAAVTLPASVTVAQGATTGTFPVTHAGVAGTTSVTITGTLAAVNKTATLSVTQAALSTLRADRVVVPSGSSLLLTLTLTGKTPAAGGTATATTTNATALPVVASTPLTGGATTPTVTLTAGTVTAPQTVTLGYTVGGVTKNVVVSVVPVLSSLTLQQPTVLVGNASTAVITLAAPAPAGGTTVTLTSGTPSVATLPASVVVPQGAYTAAVPLTGLAAGNTVLTATLSGASATSTLGVSATPGVLRITTPQNGMKQAATLTATVTLNAPAPAGGVTVNLSSSDTTAATVPATLAFTSGQTSKTVTVTAAATVSSPKTTNITASAAGVSSVVPVTVTAAAALDSLTSSTMYVTAGSTLAATIKLSANAPSAASHTLASSQTSVATVPATASVASGASTVNFNVTGVAAGETNVTATYAGVTKTLRVVVVAAGSPVPKTVTFSPTSAVSGGTSTATVTLSAAAPAGGTVVTLFSGNSSLATVGTSITVASGATTGTATVTAGVVAANTDATLEAVANGRSATGALTVTPGLPTSVGLSPTSVAAGGTSTGTVTLTGPAPTGGTVVTLSSSNAARATVPATVTVLAGQTTATFTITAVSAGTCTISAAKNGTTATSGTLTVTAAAASLSTITLAPTSVRGGVTSVGTATLTGAAPAGGAVVTLSSDNAAAVVPANVTVNAGATTTTFNVTTTAVSASQTVTITGTYGVARTGTLTVTPPAALTVSASPSSVRGGVNSNVTVTLDSAAPAGGITVGLSSNNAAAVVPATVNIPVGQTSAQVLATTIGVATNQTVTLTATLNGTKTGTLTVTAAQLTGLSLAQTTIAGGSTTTGTVTLDGVAPAAGRVVSLSSFDTNVATVPASVTVTNGQTTATFTATAQPVSNNGQSDLTATLGAQTQTQTLFVTRAVGGISGTVVDQKTGYPLVGATVVLVTNPANVAATDLNGVFTLTDVSAGSHTVSAEMYGYATQTSGTLTVTNGQTAAAGTLSLVADTLTAYGNAFNPDASENLEGVTVTAVYGGQTATTDSNGNFTMPGVTPGLELFVFHKAGYVSESSGQWLISPADNVNVNIHMRPVDLNQIHQTGVASGVVKDTAGNPLSGVTVSVAGKPSLTTTTAANGTYSLALPLGAAYVLTAQKAGFRFTASAPQPGRPGHFDTNWRVLQDFTLPTSAAVGTVNVTTVEPVSRTNGAGVVDLFVPGARYRVWTNGTGTRSVSSVPAGPMWDCRIRRDVPAASSVASNCSGNAVVPMVTPRWSAAGQVLSRATSLPITGASVRFQGPGVDETVTTDSNGRFTLSGRAEGAYAVTASAAGYSGGESLWEPTFEANVENGNFYGVTFRLDNTSEWGSLVIDQPLEAATLTQDLASLQGTATFAIPGDYVVNTIASLSNGQITAQGSTFTADGRTFTNTVTSNSQNGPQTLTVEAATRYGARLTATRQITMAIPVSPREIVIDAPGETPGGTTINAVVRLNTPASAGGVTVTLASTNPSLASLPATLEFFEGESEKSVTITTNLTATQQTVTLSATRVGVTKTAVLTVLPSTTGTLSGTILDGASGLGMADVNVVLTSDPGIWANVAHDGTYTLVNVPLGTQSVTATRQGYQTGTSSSVTVSSAQNAAIPALTLTPNPVTYTGIVQNPEQGNARIEGVTVTLARSGLSTTTDSNGVFTLVSPSLQSEILVYTKAGFQTEASELFLLNPGDVLQTGKDLRPLNPNVPQGTVRGHVRDSAGNPISGATVTVFGAAGTATTAADGSYSLTSNPGSLVVTVEKAGFRKTVLQPLPSGGYFDTPWQTLADATLYANSELGTLSLTTYDSVTKAARQGNLRLYANDKRYGVKTSASGTRTVSGAPAGPIFGEPAERTLAPGQSLSLSIPGGGTAPAGSWSAAGRIFRRTTGLPVSGATVTFTNGGFTHNETTDAEGRFVFSSGPLGDYTVTLTAPGGLVEENPWGFNASNDDGVRYADLWLVSPADIGSMAITSPAEDAILTSDPTQIQITATLPRPGDFIVNYAIGMSPGLLGPVTPVYSADGKSLTLNITGTFQNGPMTFDVYVRTRYGYSLQLQRHVTLSTASVPQGLSVSPVAVSGGSTSTATVTLNRPAPAGGQSVNLSSNHVAAALPATLVVPAGQTQAMATVTTNPVASTTPVTLTAEAFGISKTGALTVHPPAPTSLSIVPSTVLGGASATATVTIGSAAPAGGLVIALASGNAAASVPATVTVPAGQTSQTFTITTTVVTAQASATIDATANGLTASATLTVEPRHVSSLVFAPASIESGQTSTGTVTLDAPAPAAGTVVAISTDHPEVFSSLPTTVTVLSGQTTASFSAVAAAGVSNVVPAIFSAVAGGVTETSTLTVGPHPIQSFALSLSEATSDVLLTATVTLRSPAPVGGAVVALGSSHADLAPIPATLTIPEGQSTGFVTFTTVEPAVDPTNVTLTATYAGQGRTASLNLRKDPINSFIPAAGATGYTTFSIHVSLKGGFVAPVGGLVVALSSSNPAIAQVPATIVIPEGQTSVNGVGQAFPAAASEAVTLTATWGGKSRTRTFQVTALSLSGMGGPSVMTESGTATGNVVLNAKAGPGGFPVTLSSSDTVISLPASVVVPEGATAVNFTMTTPESLSAETLVTLTATANGVAQTKQVAVRPFGLSAVTFGGPSVKAGYGIPATIQFTGPAPSAGTVSVLISWGSTCGLTTPCSGDLNQSYSAGATAISIPNVYASWRGTAGTLTFNATRASQTVSGTLPITPGTFAATLSPASVRRGQPVRVKVDLDGWPNLTWSVPVRTRSTNQAVLPDATSDITASVVGSVLNFNSLYEFDLVPSLESGVTTVAVDLDGASAGVTPDLTVLPSGLTGLSANPNAVRQGASSSLRVTFDSPAPVGGSGFVVSLSSSNPGLVSVPASITVPAGSSTVVQPLTPGNVSVATDVTITATHGMDVQTATLRVLPATASLLSGTAVDGSAYDRWPAISAATASILGTPVTADETDANGRFRLYTESPSASARIEKTGHVTFDSPATPLPAGQETDIGMQQVRKVLAAGTSTFYGFVKTSAGAPVAGAIVDVVGYDRTLTTDAQGRYQFPVPDSGPPTRLRLTVSAAGFVTRTAEIRLDGIYVPGIGNHDLEDFKLETTARPTLLAVNFDKTFVNAGGDVRVTLGFSGTPPADNPVSVRLVSPWPVDTTVKTLPLPPGGSGSYYPLQVGFPGGAPTQTTYRYAFFYNGTTIYKDVLVGPSSVDVTCTPQTVVGGNPINCTIYLLTGPAPAFGADVVINNVGVFTVPYGQTTTTFQIVPAPVAATATVTQQANYQSGVSQFSYTVLPPTVSALSITPTSVSGGATATGTVTLDGTAPAGDWAVDLSSNTNAATVAASVTVPAGQRTATFLISTILVASQATATITASRTSPIAGSAQATLTVNPATMQLSGLAPGFAVPGAQDLLVYGTGLPANVSMKILGPVYPLGVINPPVLCNASSNGDCPSVTAPAVRSPAGTSAYFGVPSGLSTGLYLVRSTSPTDGDSLNGVWLAVADPEPSYPVQNEVDHQSQRRIVSGQTVLGEFGTLAPPVGDFTDFNGYYFLGTAGSRITVSLERVDTTKTWEHPDSIDPDLRIVAPDGMIYGNLYKYDNREGVDLNATITNAVLPQTGIYRIVAGTSHGSGAYRLQFNVDSVAPVNVGERIIPMGGMGATLPVGQPYDVFAAVLDSRGHPVSSANVNWTAMAGAPVFLNGTSSATSFDGVAGISLRLDTPGIARVKADATDPLLNLGAMQGEEFLKEALPRFDAVGSGPRFEGMGKNGEPRFSNAPVKTLPVELFERSRELTTPPSAKTPAAKPSTAKGKASSPAKPTGEPVGEKGLGVKISRASFPLPATAMLQNTCSNSTGTIDLGAVAGTPDGPYSFTLTDITGGGSKVIDGAAGFEDLYIGKTRTLRLDIKDATGATPNYPIVVRIGTSGTRAGTVALDANAPGCNSMFFLWHESPLLPNDIITYTLGTRAFPAEFIDNPALPGTVKPVWATTELLDVAIYVPTETILDRRTAVLYPVKPMAGEPHHLVHYDYRDMSVLPDVFKKFTGYSLTPLSGDLYGNVLSSRFTTTNTYYLEDVLGNTCAGYWNTSAEDVTPSNPDIEVEFLPQNDGVHSGSQYTNTIQWRGNATLPSGSYTTHLKVTYPASAEGGWGGGEVTKNLTYELSSTARKVLLSRENFGYDKIKADGTLGVEDAPFPISVSAGAETAALPKTQIGDTPRLAFLLTEGSRFTPQDIFPLEPTPAGGVFWTQAGTNVWVQNGLSPDPRLQVGSTAPFTLRLIDKHGAVVPEASFTVHLNARYDHLAGPCTAPSVLSTGGSVSGVVAPCGYMGIELTKAPIAPGEYYIDVRSENGEYDVLHAAGLHTDPSLAGAVQGAFAFCAVSALEFLDQQFARISSDLYLEASTVVRVRYRSAQTGLNSSLPAVVSTLRASGAMHDQASLVLMRVGTSGSFLAALDLNLPSAGSSSAPFLNARAVVAAELPLGRGAVLAEVQEEDVATQLPAIGVFFPEVYRVGFVGDQTLAKYPGVANLPAEPDWIDFPDGSKPTWETVPPLLPVNNLAAYIRNESARVFASFAVGVSLVEPVEVAVRIRYGSLVVAEAPRVTFDGSAGHIADLETLLVESKVFLGEFPLEWEMSIGGHRWLSMGTSGPHRIAWILASPLIPPFDEPYGQTYPVLYDEAVRISTYAATFLGLPSEPTLTIDGHLLRSRINRYVDQLAQYNPDFAATVSVHPLYLLQGSPSEFQCREGAFLLRGLLRSIGLSGDVQYIWSGTSSTKHDYSLRNGGTVNFEIAAPFRASDPNCPANPHFAYHAVVSDAGTLYDPSYGTSYSALQFKENVSIVNSLTEESAFVSGTTNQSTGAARPSNSIDGKTRLPNGSLVNTTCQHCWRLIAGGRREYYECAP